jgi:hypothetical protein
MSVIKKYYYISKNKIKIAYLLRRKVKNSILDN